MKSNLEVKVISIIKQEESRLIRDFTIYGIIKGWEECGCRKCIKYLAVVEKLKSGELKYEI